MKHQGAVNNPPHGLIAVGPIVDTMLSPPPQVVQLLLAQGKQMPAVAAKMMIDTGAQMTVVERSLAAQLGIAPVRFIPMVGVSQQPELCPVYPMSVSIGFSDTKALGNVEFSADIVGMSSPAKPAAHVGLLGRDFLRHFDFVYHGPTGQFEIRLPTDSAVFKQIKANTPGRNDPCPCGSGKKFKQCHLGK